MRRSLLTIISSALALILIGAGFGWYIYEHPHGIVHPLLQPPDYYWQYDPDDIYGKTGIVAIAGREFKIPVAYVEGHFKNGRMENSVVLRYVLPEFKSKLEYPNKADRRVLVSKGLMRGMLLQDAAQIPPVNEMVNNHLSSRRGFKPTGTVYGLRKFEAPIPEGKYATKPDDLYIEEDGTGGALSFIWCSPPGEDAVPSCGHTFADKGLIFHIHYNIADLPQWREQQAKAAGFIENFEQENKLKKGSPN